MSKRPQVSFATILEEAHEEMKQIEEEIAKEDAAYEKLFAYAPSIFDHDFYDHDFYDDIVSHEDEEDGSFYEDDGSFYDYFYATRYFP